MKRSSFVVGHRKADKAKMLKAVDAEIESTKNSINSLLDEHSALQTFRAILAGKNGVEAAGKFYNENEEEIAPFLPYEVIRLYNPHTN